MRRARWAGVVVLLLVAGHELRQRATAAASGVEPAAPPQRLVETGLYAGARIDVIDARARPFSPQYPLWSDGAVKRRWIRLPEGAAIDGRNPHAWQFPVGTKLWKEFSVNGRKVETRLLWKATPDGWVAASYAWNEAETDAVLAPDEGVPGLAEVAPARRHGIPSRADCATCHGARNEPLGFNTLQLSTDRDPQAIHGEPLAPDMLTVKSLADEGLISPVPADLLARPPRIAARDAGTRTVLGYLAANCGPCHDGSDSISARVPSLKYADVMRDGDAVARALVGQPTRWQAPGRPDGSTLLVDPGSPESSALLLRMTSRRPSSQMPPLGTVVRDHEAVDAVEAWIAQLRQSP